MTQAETAQPASATCGNCGATTGGTYCSVCGQDTKLEPPTVTEYFHELLAHFVHLDGKLWRTLGPLFFRPGKLPQDYLANKRARYVKPLKLYLSAIAVAFAAVQFLGWDLGLKFGGPGFDLSFYLFQQVPPPTAVAQGRLSADTIPWALEHVDTPGIRHLKALAPEEQLKVTRKRGIQYLPYLVLGLVPIYAVLLQWVYRAPHRRYAADLIFALYVHSFFLLIFVIEAKLPLALATMLSLWAIVYYALALKRVYGGTWNETWAWRSSNDTVLLDASRYRIAGDRCDAFHVTVFRKLSWARRRADRTRPVPGAASANPATLTLLETVRLKGVASGQSVAASTKCRIKSACAFMLMNIPAIETQRLRLRAFEGDDLEPYAEMYADELFVRFLSGKTLTKGQAWENMAIILGHWSLLGYGIWAIEHLGTGELVGRAGLLNLPGWPDVEVCWALSPKFWGNGYATEAAKASINWAFREAGIHRLISLIHPENRRSKAVALRLGERFREQITFEARLTDVYEVLNSERIKKE